MIQEKTVLILGAGASKPYGFPTAKELKLEICNSFVNKWRHYLKTKLSGSMNYNRIEREPKEGIAFVNAFTKFIPDSVDLFLALNPEYSDIGKTAIYLAILEAENNKKAISQMSNWYSVLFTKMVEGMRSPEDYKKFAKNEITFITFNYDRSLEQFLYNSFLALTNKISEMEKVELLKKIEIYHVYGVLAELPWQNDDNQGLTYGNEIWVQHIDENKNNIKTISERNAIDLKSLYSTIKEANRIFFLGFGFAEENVNILRLSNLINPMQSVYLSDYEDRPDKWKTKLKKLNISSQNIIIKKGDCTQVVEDYL